VDTPDDVLLVECGSLLEKLLKKKGVPLATRKHSTEFVRDTVDALENLNREKLYNSVFGFAKAVAQNKPTSENQVLKFERVTYQMIAYNVQFVNGGHQSFVSHFSLT